MKNKKKADIILAALILIFLVMAVLKHYYGEPFFLRMMIYVVEAALVGSIADWFAVTILFKKPLGLPVNPIIPTNKDKILNSLSTVVNNNLLNMDYIQSTIEAIPISKILISAIDDTDIVNKAKGALPCPTRRWSGRHCAGAGSTARSRRSTNNVRCSGGLPASQEADGRPRTRRGWQTSSVRDGCSRLGSPPSTRRRRTGCGRSSTRSRRSRSRPS